MIVVATTLHPYVTNDLDTSEAWLYGAEALVAQSPEPVQFFAALQLDERGLTPFAHLLSRMADLPSAYWTYTLDDGRTEVTTQNRVRHITFGQNLTIEYAMSTHASHLLFMAADCAPPPSAIPQLLELRWPIVGGEVTTYCLSGESVESHPDTGQLYGFPVQRHMATAAFIMLRRDLFRRIRWRWDFDTTETDDPCMWRDAKELYGLETLVRKDCVGRHFPLHVDAIETRGHDMSVHR